MSNRREFLKWTAAAAASAGFAPAVQNPLAAAEPEKPVPPLSIPRWRGFNLLDMFTMRSRADFAEDDFRWMQEWGFDFVRLPMCYRLWTVDGDDYKINEAMLEKLDRAVDLGQKYNIHVNLNFHRGPGYSVNAEFNEPHNLWKDQTALDAFVFHWTLLAKRYKAIAKEKLSINLINEPKGDDDPAHMTRADHERVVRTTVKAIREISPDRIIFVDGLRWARLTCPELADLGCVQSAHAYDPHSLTHYKASWVSQSEGVEPAWPGNGYDRAKLEELYKPWIALKQRGVPIHFGEGGAYNKTPHNIVLAWLQDVMEILKANGVGYAIWNFRGSFGILDSGRADVDYEDFHGRKLDRKMLTLLQKS
jgi:endoglucanase